MRNPGRGLRTSALNEIITLNSGASADNDRAAIAKAVSAIVKSPREAAPHYARRRAEDFTWHRAATGRRRPRRTEVSTTRAAIPNKPRSGQGLRGHVRPDGYGGTCLARKEARHR